MHVIVKHIAAMSAVCLSCSLAEQLPIWDEQATTLALAGLLINMCLFASAVRKLVKS